MKRKQWVGSHKSGRRYGMVSATIDWGLCIDSDPFFVLIKGSIDTSLSKSSMMTPKSTRSIVTRMKRRTTKARCDQTTSVCSKNEATTETIHAVVPWKLKQEI